MSKKPRKKKPLNYRRVKNWVLSFIGLIIIFMAISFSLARVAIKSVPDYNSSLQQFISDQLGFKVEIGLLDAEMNWLVPRLNLINVNVFDRRGQHMLHLDEIDLSLDWITTMKTQLPAVGEIALVGLNAQFGITEKSQLVLQDYVVDENIENILSSKVQADVMPAFQVSENLKYYINNLDFRVLDSQILVFDNRGYKKSRALNNFNLLLVNHGDKHKFEIKADFPESYGKHLQMIMDIDGDLFDYKNLKGQAYLSLENIFAAPLLDDLWDELGIAANADVNAQIWLGWKAQDITDVYSRFTLKDMAVHYLDTAVKTWSLDSLDGEVWWQRNDKGWQLDIRNLKSVRNGTVWPKSSAASITMIDEKAELHIQADYIRIEGITYIAGMMASIYDAQDPWIELLHKYKPTGDVEYLDVLLPVNLPEKTKLTADFGRLGLTLPDTEPSLISNLSGSVNYGYDHARFYMSSNDARIEFNKLFRDPMQLNQIKGVVDVYNRPNVWEILTDSLTIKSPHIETESRMALSIFENRPPFLDLTTLYKNGDAKYTSLYLPVGIMGKETVTWLDKAIKSGEVTTGGYQFYGQLKDMPFRNYEGISLAYFNAKNINLYYLDNWPDINGIDATLRFENDSMLIDGRSGQLFGSNITHARASISSLYSPVLDIKGNIDTRLGDIKAYVDNSSLRKGMHDYIDNVELQGEGKLDVNLFIPLKNAAHTEWGGKLSVDNGTLKLKNENYMFNNVVGELKFANGFIEASGINATLDGGQVEAGVATQQKDGYKNYHIDVAGFLDSKSILAPLPFLQKYISGSANWDVNVDIANSHINEKEIVRVEVGSDLKEVESSLPGPLSKQLGDKLPLNLQIKVLDNSRLSYQLRLSDNKRFKLDEFKTYRTVLADTPGIKGNLKQYKFEQKDKPVEVNLSYFDVDAFLGATTAKAEAENNLKLTEVQPDDIPSINFFAKKVNWKKLDFNGVEVKTSPMSSGIGIDKFKFSTSNYDVSGKGNWITSWNNQHATTIAAKLNVNNLGDALKQMDITSDIKDGDGSVNLQLKWNGKPEEFSLGALQGTGALSFEDGTFTKIDAGAGRMLGLFNLKTLFSLDFANQVSRGFSFDKLKGSFTLANGSVYTDNLAIESKVADVTIKGRLAISDKTIQQTVKVRPHVGSTVTFGTAVVAGPAIGGLVYLFQKLFDPDALTEYEYSVSGAISDPVIKLLSAPKKEKSKDNGADF